MSDHYQYVDTYYRSSYSDGENMDSGATHFNYGYPSEACYGFGQATASSPSASVLVEPNQLPRNVERFVHIHVSLYCTCVASV